MGLSVADDWFNAEALWKIHLMMGNYLNTIAFLLLIWLKINECLFDTLFTQNTCI